MRRCFLGLLCAGLMAWGEGMELPVVGGHEMYPDKNVIENVSASADHTTLVAAIKAAGLVDLLSGEGPFTVFAPTNAAFQKLPAGTLESLMKAGNKEALAKLLQYHVVSGKVTAFDLRRQVKEGNGSARLTTVNGETLTVTQDGVKIVLTDAKGGKATITIGDVFQSNGVMHVIDEVMLTK